MCTSRQIWDGGNITQAIQILYPLSTRSETPLVYKWKLRDEPFIIDDKLCDNGGRFIVPSYTIILQVPMANEKGLRRDFDNFYVMCHIPLCLHYHVKILFWSRQKPTVQNT